MDYRRRWRSPSASDLRPASARAGRSWLDGVAARRSRLTDCLCVSVCLCIEFAAGLSHAAHTSAGLEGAVGLLCEAWGTEPPTPVSMRAGSSMCMVELPPALEITDTPGVPGAGVRGQLRERYKIEAAVRETSF